MQPWRTLNVVNATRPSHIIRNHSPRIPHASHGAPEKLGQEPTRGYSMVCTSVADMRGGIRDIRLKFQWLPTDKKCYDRVKKNGGTVVYAPNPLTGIEGRHVRLRIRPILDPYPLV